MNSLSKGIGKVQVRLRWDPSPSGTPPRDLDLVAATYLAGDREGTPAYVVHFASRAPDGTITLDRDSRTGQGFGFDEVMTLELDRLAPRYVRVVVGVVIQQGGGRMTFGDIANPGVRVQEEYTLLAESDFAGVSGSRSTTVAEFTRDGSDDWVFHPGVRGFDVGPDGFARVMGSGHS